MSVENIITENLDIWTSAIKTKSASGRGSSKKLELYGIKRLRKLILDLATSGKLTAQEQTDQPVGLLLEKLKDERLSLRKNQNLKKIKSLPPISENEIMAEIPNSWAWIRFGECVVIRSGNSFPKEKEVPEGNIPYCKVGDMNLPENKTSITTSSRYINPNSKDLLALIPANSIAFPKRGGAIATNKKKYVKQPLFVDLNVMAVTPFEPLLLEYVMIWLESIDLAELNTGTSVPQINNKDVEPLLFPCPPIDEQRRIVEKVNELKSLCDLLESQTEASIEAHQTLVKSLLETLTNAKDADELNESWQCISEHFDVLFTTEESIDQLKQTILQLAVMGKLVKQDPNDEPASKLLERIAAEKEQLIKDKKIKKQTELKEVNESDFPFSTPEGWAVVRLGALIPQFQNGASSRGDKKGKETIVLRLADIKDWRISENDTRRLIINEETIEKYLLKKGDTLIIRVNGSSEIVGRFITVEKETDAIYCDHFIRMRFPIPCIEPNYLAILGSSRLVRDKISDLFISTAGQKTVNQTHISSLTLSIPPIMEQKRISERVRYLVAICDELKSKLQTVQRTISNVADSVKANY
ncbi:restriction endonuclease subunit S [Alteromonas macleodii]